MAGRRAAVGTALPVELTSFVGRRRELNGVTHGLERSRLVSIVGQGGVGKTRLAGRLAREKGRVYADGLWWCELAALTDPDHLVDAVAGELQVDAATVEQLAERTRRWSALVVLDNCEHLIDGCARLATGLLQRCPDLRILTTTRERLGVPGESVFRLTPLPVADAPSRPDSSDAVALFVDRAERLVPAFDATAQLDTIRQICARLDGLPLAIELAAAWLPVMSPAAILGRLGEPLRLLTQAGPPDTGRYRSLTESIAWSYELCTPAERALWRHLSPFVGGCAIDVVEFVAARIGVPPEQTLTVLEGLVRKSVIAHHVVDGADWYTMLVALREFGLAALDTESERDEAYQILLGYYLDFFQRAEADWYSPRQAHWLAQFARELPNVRQALEFALSDERRSAAAFGLTVPLWRAFWLGEARMDELRRWVARALAQTSGDDEPRQVAKVLHAYAVGLLDGVEAMRPMLQEIRERAVAAGNTRVSELVGAVLASALPAGPDAIAGYERFMRYAGEDPQLLAGTGIAIRLALLYDRFGHAEPAAQLSARIVELSTASGERFDRAYLLFGLGANALARGDLDLAAAASRESLQLRLGVPTNAQTAHAIETIALAAHLDGDSAYAACLLGVADAIWHRLGDISDPYPQILADRPVTREALRRALGDRDFDERLGRGRDMPLEYALRYAIDPGAAPDEVEPPGERATSRAASYAAALTRREHEVARLVAEGLTDNQIAARLVISPRTAQGHVQKALVKLGLTSRTQLAMWVTEAASAPA